MEGQSTKSLKIPYLLSRLDEKYNQLYPNNRLSLYNIISHFALSALYLFYYTLFILMFTISLELFIYQFSCCSF
jgi:hypothetical protein